MLEGAGIAVGNSLTTPCNDGHYESYAMLADFAASVGVKCIIS